MNRLSAIFFCFLLVFCAFFAVKAQDVTKLIVKKKSNSIRVNGSKELQKILDNAVATTIERFWDKGLKANLVAATLIDLREKEKPKMANYRGEEQIYPASVVKMFYMAALHRQLEDGKVKLTPELERGLRDMIVDSSNEATGYILDVLTGTSSGAELPEKEFKKWAFKRNWVNRYYESLGYKNINVNQKTHCEDAYGIEQQFRNYKGENRNMLTTNATAKLLTEIVLGSSVTPERSKQMMELMKRDWEKPVKNIADKEFISHALSPGTKLWSKEGFTSTTRHDAAYIETPDGAKFVLVIYTENLATERDIIPSIAKGVLEGL
jgi:beta-lactamase class A